MNKQPSMPTADYVNTLEACLAREMASGAIPPHEPEQVTGLNPLCAFPLDGEHHTGPLFRPPYQLAHASLVDTREPRTEQPAPFILPYEVLAAELRPVQKRGTSFQRQDRELADLFENTPVGLHRMTHEGTILEVNRAELSLLGYAREDFVGHNISEFFMDADAARQLCRRLAGDGIVCEFEARLRHRDGSVKHVVIDANVFRDQDQFVHSHCFVRDITERRHVEQALRRANDELESAVKQRTVELLRTNETLQVEIERRRRVEEAILESEKRYRLIVETAEEGIWVIDDANRTTFVNHKLAQMLGQHAEKMIGQPLSSFLEEADRARVEAHVERCRQGLREQHDFKLRHCHGTGLWALLTTSPIFNDDGQYAGALAMVSDVTERRQAEEELRKRERQLAQAQRIAKLGSWEWEIEANKVTWSDELRCIYGLDAHTSQITCEVFLNCVHPEDRPQVQQIVGNACRSGESYDLTYRIVRPDSSERVLHAYGKVVIDERGKPIRLIGTAQDITERRLAEEALRQSEEHYRELFHQACLMQEKLRNLSNRILAAQEEERKRISRELHDEVGQALTAINVNLALLKREATAANGALVGRIGDTQGLLERTMENVHRFARELRPAMLDDLGLLPALRSYVKDFAARTGINVRFTAPPGEEGLDSEQKTVLYRVAQESLNNIAKHAHATEVEIALQELRHGLIMEIKDNGQGFPAGPQTNGKGSNRLGLLGMQERVRLANGTFSVQSQAGAGTRVQVEIPVQRSLPPAELKCETVNPNPRYEQNNCPSR